ncbi:MAG: S-layer homology domain-containing protein [Cyanobacteriota bacterium]|nr:S-layer homology domain-containing protein [Cyanobacteriota bacterium]
MVKPGINLFSSPPMKRHCPILPPLPYLLARGRLLLLVGCSLATVACQGSQWGNDLSRWLQATPASTPSPGGSPSANSSSPLPRPSAPLPLANSSPAPTPSASSPSPVPSPPPNSRFTDVPDPFTQGAIRALDGLGVFVDIPGATFDPSRSVKRGEFARWLVVANNAIHWDQPSRQIRLGSLTERPIFLDVTDEHPHFLYIQALGLAGLIEGDANQEFRPESLLSRAELIRLKVPLDLPPGKIAGSVSDIQEQWGFTDTASIPLEAVPSIVADRTLGDHSTLLRTFGPIRLFHATYPVTRGEAALALAQFGKKSAATAVEEAPLPLVTPPLTPASPSPEVVQPSPTPIPSLATPSPQPSPSQRSTISPSPDPLLIPTPASDTDPLPGRFITPTNP